MSKYNNKKTIIDGITFDSKAEAQRYTQLLLMQRAGLITGLQLQVPFTLIPKSSKGRAVVYKADFVYFDTEKKKQVIEDVKGVRTQVYVLKKRLMQEQGLEIVEV